MADDKAVRFNVRAVPGDDTFTVDEADRGELSADQIVSQFASESGLSLADVVSNYAKYADDIHRSFLVSSLC